MQSATLERGICLVSLVATHLNIEALGWCMIGCWCPDQKTSNQTLTLNLEFPYLIAWEQDSNTYFLSPQLLKLFFYMRMVTFETILNVNYFTNKGPHGENLWLKR